MSWSFSRSRSLRGCLRAHWYGTYSKGEPEAGRAKVLKMLVTLDMLAGQVVDMQVNSALDDLREGKSIPENLPERAVDVWNRMLKNSNGHIRAIKAGRGIPKGAQPLFRDYYEEPIDSVAEDRCAGRVARSMTGFLNSEILERIKRTNPNRWSPAKNLSDFNAAEWFMSDVRIYSSTDFWLDYGEKGLVVFDWKSSVGVGSDEAFQLASYSLYGQWTRSLPREKVLVQAVHLPATPSWDAKPISEVECESAQSTIVKEAADELLMVEEREQSDGRIQFVALRENFPPKAEHTLCGQCRYRAICPEGNLLLAGV